MMGERTGQHSGRTEERLAGLNGRTGEQMGGLLDGFGVGKNGSGGCSGKVKVVLRNP